MTVTANILSQRGSEQDKILYIKAQTEVIREKQPHLGEILTRKKLSALAHDETRREIHLLPRYCGQFADLRTPISRKTSHLEVLFRTSCLADIYCGSDVFIVGGGWERGCNIAQRHDRLFTILSYNSRPSTVRI